MAPVYPPMQEQSKPFTLSVHAPSCRQGLGLQSSMSERSREGKAYWNNLDMFSIGVTYRLRCRNVLRCSGMLFLTTCAFASYFGSVAMLLNLACILSV